MPSRKQRRRRAKDRRHEYEYVYVDDDGHEVAVDSAEVRPEKAQTKGNGRAAKPTARRGGAGGGRQIRPAEPPSWQRVRKRALIVGPLMFVAINFLGKNLTLVGRVVQTLVMLALFLPFSYLMDRTVYRAYLRRVGGDAAKGAGKRR
jgi:hypothetical protein